MRRGHGSTKVPNVKLRPVPQAARVVEDDTSMEGDSMDLEGELSAPRINLFVHAKPFGGVILSCTGIRDKAALFKQATELGARCQLDLTSDVTHLIATETGSAKYACAIDNGMTVMTPEWVSETYAAWLQGESIDLAETVEKFRFRFLTGLTISVTGDIDIDRRKDIHRLVVAHGGTYSSNLTKVCTHLLVCGTSFEAVASTDKVKFALRVNKDLNGQMHILWVEWFWDCMDWLGRLEEEKYKIQSPRPLRKVKPAPQVASLSCPAQSITSVGTTLPASQRSQARAPPAPVTIDVAHDAPELGVAPARSQPALDAQKASLWRQIQRANIQGAASASSSQEPKQAGKAINRDLPTLEEALREPSAVLALPVPKAQIKRMPSMQPEAGPSSKSVLNRLATSRASSFNPDSEVASRLNPALFKSRTTDAEPSLTAPQRKKGVFEGKRICLIGDAKSSVLEGAIRSSGGILVEEAEINEEDDDMRRDLDWLIVRLISGSKHLPDSSSGLLPKYMTECWVEQCLHEERICEPDEHISFRPVVIDTPVAGADNMRIHISGLADSDSLYNQRLARTLGAQVAVVFSRKSTTHLICTSSFGTKFEHATQWGMPVVQPMWLHEMARTGIVPHPTKHRVRSAAVISDITNDDGAVQYGRASSRPTPQPAIPGEKETIQFPPRENIPEGGLRFGLPDPNILPPVSVAHFTPAAVAPERPATSPGKLQSAKTANTTRAASTALNDLAALLGKRKSTEPEARIPAQKKKTRPVARVRSVEDSSGSTTDSKGNFTPLQPFAIPGRLADGVEHPIPSPTASFVRAPVEESMRVTYEDPESRAARRGLMRLIGEEAESQDVEMAQAAAADKVVEKGKGRAKTGTTRRSARIP